MLFHLIVQKIHFTKQEAAVRPLCGCRILFRLLKSWLSNRKGIQFFSRNWKIYIENHMKTMMVAFFQKETSYMFINVIIAASIH
jgi:hypothetical protein